MSISARDHWWDLFPTRWIWPLGPPERRWVVWLSFQIGQRGGVRTNAGQAVDEAADHPPDEPPGDEGNSGDNEKAQRCGHERGRRLGHKGVARDSEDRLAD